MASSATCCAPTPRDARKTGSVPPLWVRLNCSVPPLWVSTFTVQPGPQHLGRAESADGPGHKTPRDHDAAPVRVTGLSLASPSYWTQTRQSELRDSDSDSGSLAGSGLDRSLVCAGRRGMLVCLVAAATCCRLPGGPCGVLEVRKCGSSLCSCPSCDAPYFARLCSCPSCASTPLTDLEGRHDAVRATWVI